MADLAQDRELVSDFVLEAQDHLRAVEANLLQLDRGAADPEAIHAAFRAFHTIKGLAGFLEFKALQEVAHEVETVLDQARNGQITMSPAIIDVVLDGADYLKQWIGDLESSLDSGALPPVPEYGTLTARLRAVTAPAECTRGAPELAMLADAVSQSDMAVAPDKPLREARAVKVDTCKLDYLVDMVGEMVIAQSMIRHDPDLGSINRPRLKRNLSQLSRITDEIQKTAMAMRMMPVGRLFERMARLVRDLARKTGKEVELEISGGETELDRNLVEELADPLMHMLRNAMDHGIELPEERVACGKPRIARVGLRAAHQAGKIAIQVSDDGRGLDREKIIAKAVRNGLVDAHENLSGAEVYNLIFQPGFSTADRVTDVSGRGVGMDVVRRHVQKLRGRIEIESTPGQGAAFHLKLPLTLAILDGLIVGVGAERYILPLFAVREMLRPTPETVFTVQDKGEVALVRDQLLPVVRLYQRFGVTATHESVTDSLLIVAENSTRSFCVIVDELIGKQEVVIKSLGAMLQNVPGIAGGAILGDGRIGLILDLDRVFESSQRRTGRV